MPLAGKTITFQNYLLAMQNLDPKTIFKNLLKVYWFLFLGMIVFLVIAALLVSNSGPIMEDDPYINQVFKILVIAFTVAGIPLAYTIPQKRIKKINAGLGLAEKLNNYQGALIIRFAITEGVAFFATIAFLLTGDTDLMLLLAIIYLFYIISRPSPFKTAGDLELSEEEKHQLFGDN